MIELLSESTEAIDRGEKMRIYARIWRTGHYVLHDPETQRLEAYELVRGAYVPIAPDARGDLPIAGMDLALGVRPGVYSTESGSWLRWIGSDGRPLPTGTERAELALARVAELEAELASRR